MMRKEREKPADHGHEVSTARGRLEGALQVLIERTESEGSDESDVDVTDLIHEGRSASASPRKLGSTLKAPLRKRRRLNVEKVYKNDQHSYVLKLYDRSVDLAKFSPNTALYPVCRAWIKNRPNNQHLNTNTNQLPMKIEEHAADAREGAKVEEIRENDVTYLPPPKPMPMDEDGNVIDTRIPKDLVSCTTKSVDFSELSQRSEDSLPTSQSLLQEHCARWTRVREQWKQAAATNEARYSESTKILKNILLRQ